jgi:hypothetical protein
MIRGVFAEFGHHAGETIRANTRIRQTSCINRKARGRDEPIVVAKPGSICAADPTKFVSDSATNLAIFFECLANYVP